MELNIKPGIGSIICSGFERFRKVLNDYVFEGPAGCPEKVLSDSSQQELPMSIERERER